MTAEEINTFINNLKGIVECGAWTTLIAGASMIKMGKCQHENCVPPGHLPNYCESYDAIYSVLPLLDTYSQPWSSNTYDNGWVRFHSHLSKMVGATYRTITFVHETIKALDGGPYLMNTSTYASPFEGVKFFKNTTPHMLAEAFVMAVSYDKKAEWLKRQLPPAHTSDPDETPQGS